ncbi:Imm26 family immunity protein [Cystobacter ferrugineus]|uniref:Uncharacterized protein n=1 Tax=Cystobacter ferrugineus TaxID=83449 RepID=A0A1L9AWU8_9BACT|nr:Imm26 family immunity protein [Cystobacter ferrugineus]OJH34467.1 hypothetical protein BON30_43910 [Cystobacter ferrugineus]
MKSTYKPGSFLRIPLPDGSFGHARTLEPPFDAFYDYRTTTPESELGRIASKPILFKIVVRSPYPDSWEFIGWRALEEHFTQPIVQYRQEVGPFGRCTIFDTLGNVRDAEPHECIGLEPSAVWEPHGVEKRLLDAFMGRPNAALERMKAELRDRMLK